MRSFTGFSLIELLVALVVLGILFSLALPSVQWVRRRAYDSAVTAHLREAMGYQFVYAAEHGDFTDDLSALRAEGLKEVPGVELELRSGGGSFCMLARHRYGRYWYAATPSALVNTGVRAQDPAPADCP